MNCLKCGYELKNEEKVCPMCGTEINNNEKERSNIEDEKRYQRKKYIIMISVITILLIINALFKEKENKHDNEFEKNVFNVWVTIDEDGSKGWPQHGITAGTKWEDIPDDWTCPDCGVSKADFEMVEI